MDFHSLARKDLQTLCKKNKIPANITNVAMAEALAALQEVAGIEEFLSPIESESKRSEDRIDNGSPRHCRTSCRTSSRRKPVKEESPFTQSIVRSRRGRVAEVAEQENKDSYVSSTPLPSDRRRAPVPSARKKLESHSIEGKDEENDQNNGDQKRSDVLETPSMAKTQRKVSALGSTRRKTDARRDKSSVQGACSTRRSMRLLERTMENLSLMERGSTELVVTDKLFEEMPERKGSKISTNDFLKSLNIDEIDSKLMNETKDKEEEQANGGSDGESKEKVKMVDEIEEDDTIAVKEPVDEIQCEAALNDQCESEDEIQSEAAIEEHQGYTPSCTYEFSTENFNQENGLSAESPLLQEKVEKVQVLSDGESSVMAIVESDIGELIDVHVVESELVENSIKNICNVEEKLKDSDSKDSFSEPKIDEDLSKSDEILIEDSEKIDNFSFPEPKIEDLRKSDEISIEDSDKIDNFSFPEPKVEDLRKSDESPVKDSEKMDHSSFTPFAVDQIQGQFPRPAAEVTVQESRTSLEIFEAADEDKEDTKNKPNEDEEITLSLRQLRKMVKELHLSKKSNKEKTYGKVMEQPCLSIMQEKVGKVARTALQPLSENCLAKDAQDKTTTTTAANSMFIQ